MKNDSNGSKPTDNSAITISINSDLGKLVSKTMEFEDDCEQQLKQLEVIKKSKELGVSPKALDEFVSNSHKRRLASNSARAKNVLYAGVGIGIASVSTALLFKVTSEIYDRHKKPFEEKEAQRLYDEAIRRLKMRDINNPDPSQVKDEIQSIIELKQQIRELGL